MQHLDGLLGVGGGALGGGVEFAEGVGAAGGGPRARARPQRLALLRQVPVRECVPAAPRRRPPHVQQRTATHVTNTPSLSFSPFPYISDNVALTTMKLSCSLWEMAFPSSQPHTINSTKAKKVQLDMTDSEEPILEEVASICCNSNDNPQGS